MRRQRTPVLLLAALIVAAVCASAAAYVPPGVRTVVLTVRHSKFSVAELNVRRGETVRFVVRNTDPIDHELIVGPMSVQDRHESGREPHHGAVPGEVTVPLFEEASTEYTFERSGTQWFGCHLPGHWDYGMRGRIVVS